MADKDRRGGVDGGAGEGSPGRNASSMPAVFAARQPIVGREGELVAYELLFRGAGEIEGPLGGAHATATVLSEAVLTLGMAELTGSMPAFINFTEELLLNGTAELLSPPAGFVVEVLEDVPQSARILDECRRLRSKGFKVALDDVVAVDRIRAFAGVIDIVKVDIRLAPRLSWRALVQAARQAHALALAEKVETTEEMIALRDMGFDYFQGYALGRPTGVEQKPLVGLSATHARLLEVIERPEVSLDELEEVVGSDPTLSYRVLAYANSAHAAQRRKIDSLRAALVLFGQEDIRRAARLVVFSGLCTDMPEHVMVQSLVRSRLCEELAPLVGQEAGARRYALCGLLSTLDVMLGLPMAEVVRRLPITEDITAALVARTGKLGAVLALAESYERGDWELVGTRAARLGITSAALPPLYRRALQGAAKLLLRGGSPPAG